MMPDTYISPDWELPISSGEYEVKGFVGEGVAYYDSEKGAFNPSPGVIGVIGWRVPLPEAADLAEFRARLQMNWPCIGRKDETYGYEDGN